MYKVKFDTGQEVSFEKEPTQADIEEASKQLELKPVNKKPTSQVKQDVQSVLGDNFASDVVSGVGQFGVGVGSSIMKGGLGLAQTALKGIQKAKESPFAGHVLRAIPNTQGAQQSLGQIKQKVSDTYSPETQSIAGQAGNLGGEIAQYATGNAPIAKGQQFLRGATDVLTKNAPGVAKFVGKATSRIIPEAGISGGIEYAKSGGDFGNAKEAGIISGVASGIFGAAGDVYRMAFNPNTKVALQKALGVQGKQSAGKALQDADKKLEGFQVMKDYSPNIKVKDLDGNEKAFDTSSTNFTETLQAWEQSRNMAFNEYNQIAKKATGKGLLVELQPVIDELLETNAQPATSQTKRAIVGAYNDLVENFTSIDEAGNRILQADPEKLQIYIEDLNRIARGVFRGTSDMPSGEVAATVATKLREVIDDAISKSGDGQYQVARNKYAALKSIEGDLVRRFKQMNRKIGNGLADYSDAFFSGDLIAGIVSQEPRLLIMGLTGKAVNKIAKKLKDPERYLRQVFEGVGEAEPPSLLKQRLFGGNKETPEYKAGKEMMEGGVNKTNVLNEEAKKNLKNPTNAQGGFAQVFKNEGDLTTKILKDLEGKTTVSKQYILDATNRGELKQVERDLIRDILERETKVDTALTFKNLQADDYNTGIFGKDFDEPVKFYRGGSLKPNSKGEMWFTPEDWQALKYSEDFDAPSVDKVSEALINSKKPFLLEGSEMGAYSKEIKDNWKKIGLKETDWNINDPKVKDKAIAYAKKNGYDSVFFRDSSIDGQTPMSSLVIFDEKLAKYNKIGSKVEKTGKEQLSDTINVSDFAKKVKAELLPVERVEISPQYENISLPDDIRGEVLNYKEHVYTSPIKTSAGWTHFGGTRDYNFPGSKNRPDTNYFGHTRVEDLAGDLVTPKLKTSITEKGGKFYTKAVTGDGMSISSGVFPTRAKAEESITRQLQPIAQKNIRRVIEVQSDLYQKGNPLDKLDDGYDYKYLAEMEEAIKKGEGYSDYAMLKKAKEKGLLGLDEAKAKLSQYNDPTAHFRMVREEIKKASQDGKTKLQFPTGETAMKIEGLGENTNWYVTDDITEGLAGNARLLDTPDLKVGSTISHEAHGDAWIITDVLGDGKFKAIPKQRHEQLSVPTVSEADRADFISKYAEQFDISGKVDTNNPIYKFYEKDVTKYLNKFGGKRIVDDKGVSWIEIPITKEQGKAPVEAFGKAQMGAVMKIGLGSGAVAGALQLKNRNNK